MLRCNISFVIFLILLTLCIIPFSVHAQTDQTPVDRDVPKIQEDQREPAPIAPDQGAVIKHEMPKAENDSMPVFTKDTSFDSLKTVLSSDSLAVEEPVLAKKEFLFTNLDMQVTALTFVMWIVMMCWAAFSS
jgi:hypothetical protein